MLRMKPVLRQLNHTLIPQRRPVPKKNEPTFTSKLTTKKNQFDMIYLITITKLEIIRLPSKCYTQKERGNAPSQIEPITLTHQATEQRQKKEPTFPSMLHRS